MNAAPILWSGADRFGREARAGDGGPLRWPGWSGAGVAAVRLSLPDAWKREDAPNLEAKIIHYTPSLCRSRSNTSAQNLCACYNKDSLKIVRERTEVSIG